eukprot:TRINITY_DN2510_c0_g1_i1.p1 TRINITY_DN2510_c0_g1~~TRINITY_DN2510_c0_g1_i1.p1  ORF type:complete len:662 (-),score=198.83 TRINITY_DN2510_c0_g1_i1:36-2021(-)
MVEVVRSSKFRNIFASVRSKCGYEALKPKVSRDTNALRANNSYYCVDWQTSGFGAIGVFPVRDGDNPKIAAKVPPNVPLIEAHSKGIADFELSPFESNLLVTADSSYIRVWRLPDLKNDLLKEKITECDMEFSGNNKNRIFSVHFHPVAKNVLITTSRDVNVKFFDLEHKKETISIEGTHTDIVQSITWNWDGSTLVTSCKDKIMRIWDPRNKKMTAECTTHQNSKGFRASWLGKRDQLITTGFNKQGEREFSIWDVRNITNSLKTTVIDTQPGPILPFFEMGTNIVFLAGKGDAVIRAYEVVDDASVCHYLTDYKSTSPQSDIISFPPRSVDVLSCEIIRFAKLSIDKIEHLMFQVPRRDTNNNVFQEDIYPPTLSGEPGLSAKEWFKGKNADPPLISLKPEGSVSIYEVDPGKKDREEKAQMKASGSSTSEPEEPIEFVIPKLQFTRSSRELPTMNVESTEPKVEVKKKEGKQVETFADGSTYDGNFKSDVMEGQGTLKCVKDSSIYEGEWAQNKRHGKGAIKLPVKGSSKMDVLDGYWEANKLTKGTYKFADGDVFEFESKDESSGVTVGAYKWANGDKYVGTWKHGKRHGKGKMTWKSGESYDGEFRDDKRDGQGTYVFSDGSTHIGGWRHDKMHGKGVYKVKGKQYEAEWKNGQRL